MGTFGGNGGEGREDTHGFSSEDHGEAGAIFSRRDMGYARRGSSAGSGGNAVIDDLHRETAGNRSTVGSVAVDIQSVRRREGLRGGRSQEGRMVVSRGGREASPVNLGGGTGSKD